MRQREWKKLKTLVATLTLAQRRALKEELSAEDDAAASVEVIESRAKPNLCPHCQSDGVVRNGSAHGLQRYKCRNCGRSFNALTGMPLARLRQKGKWLAQADALCSGKTITEADETFFLRSRKGERRLDRKPRRRGGRASADCRRSRCRCWSPGTVQGRRPISLAADGKADLVAALKPLLPTNTILCTDGSSVLAAAVKAIGVMHRPVNVSAGQRVLAGVYHIQNVNAFDSRLKTWIRRFHGVATKYLDSYLGWFRTLDRYPTSGLSPTSFFGLALRGRFIPT